MAKHIIWDWNGTLFDDAWLCVDIMNGLLSRRNLPPLTLFRYQAVFDFPVIDYYQAIGLDFSVEPFEVLSNEFMAEYQRRSCECQLRDGVREVLAGIQQQGRTQSILSAMKQDLLEEMIDHFGLSSHFSDIVGISNHHAHGKIESAQRWIAKQTLNREDMLFVGDTTHDFAVAQTLGISCVFVPSGHHSRERLLAAGGSILENLSDLLV